MTTTATLIVQGQGYRYTVVLNDEPVLESILGPEEAGVCVHPLSSLLLDGPNTFRVGGTPLAPGAMLHVVLGTEQVGSEARALVDQRFTDSFGVSASLDLGSGDGLPREMPLGADLAGAQGLVMGVHEAAQRRDGDTLSRLLRPVAEFWSQRDETDATWEHSDYFRVLRSFIDDPEYAVRPLTSLRFESAAGGRLRVPMQGELAALTFEHRTTPEAHFEFQIALAPTPSGWSVVR